MSAMGRTRRSRLPDGDIARILDGLDAWGLKSLYVGERGLDFGNESLRVVEKWRGLKELALPVCVVSDGPILAKARELLDRLPGVKKVEVLGAPDNILRQAEEGITYHFSCRLVWPPNWTSNSVTVMI